MLEIVAHILVALLAFKGLDYLLQAMTRPREYVAAMMLSVVAAVVCLVLALVFFKQVDDQAERARQAFDAVIQPDSAVPEAVAPRYPE